MVLKLEDVKDRYASGTQWLKLLIAGPPGVGKTLFAATFPNVLYADAEGRLLSVRKRDVKAVKVSSTAVLDELRAALAQSPEVRAKVLGAPVDTIVLDTVDEIARLIIRERLKAEKRETMAMADWGYLGDTLRSMLRGFRNLPLNVLLNVHLKPQEDSESGRIFYKPSIQGSVGDEIAAYVDESFFMVARPTVDPRTGERVIVRHLQTYPDVQHDWVKDHSGTLPQEFPVDFATDYERLSQLIFGDQPAPPANPPSELAVAPGPPSPDAVAAGPEPAKPAPKASPKAAPRSQQRESVSAPIATAGMSVSAPAPTDNGTSAAVLRRDTASTTDSPTIPCADCAAPLHKVDDEKQITQSQWRWKAPLCRACYVNRKSVKSASPATTSPGE